MQAIKGTFDLNGLMYSYSGEVPEPVVFAYSKHIYVRLTINDADGKPAVAMPIMASVDTAGKQINERRYTNTAGQVTFDIARIIQMSTDNRERELVDLIFSRNETRRQWLASSVRLRLGIDNYSAIIYDNIMEAVNGAVSSDEQWLTSPVSMKYWRGLPHTFDFLNVDTIEASSDGASFSPMSWVPGNSTLRQIPIMRSKTEGIVAGVRHSKRIKADGIGISNGVIVPSVNQVNIEIDSFCGDLSRYTYLRWLGRHGEVFYWLFRNGTQTTAVKSERHSIALREDVREGATLLNGIRKEPTREVSRAIASEYVSREHYKVLSSVISSPCVDMYLGNVDGEDLWKRVDVADGSVAENMKRAGGRVYSVTLSINIGD